MKLVRACSGESRDGVGWALSLAGTGSSSVHKRSVGSPLTRTESVGSTPEDLFRLREGPLGVRSTNRNHRRLDILNGSLDWEATPFVMILLGLNGMREGDFGSEALRGVGREGICVGVDGDLTDGEFEGGVDGREHFRGCGMNDGRAPPRFEGVVNALSG